MRYILAAVLALGSSGALASTVTIGSDTSNNCAPFGCSVGGNWDYLQIFSAKAFSGPITFDKITFFDTSFPGPVLSGDYNVSFSTTSAPLGVLSQPPSLRNTSAFFSGALGGPLIGNSFSIAGSPYTYNPSTGNLVMQIVVTNQQIKDGGGQYLDADEGGPFSRYVTGSGFAPFSDNVGLVTQFTVDVPEPSTWAMMLIGFAVIGLMTYRRRKSATLVA
jgi:PEP-CTERM motif